MAKGFERPEYRGRRDPFSGGMDRSNHPDVIAIQKLNEVVSDLFMCTDENDRTRLWSSAGRLLGKTKADKQRVSKIMIEKRVGALSKLVTELDQTVNSKTLSAPPAASAAKDVPIPTPAMPQAAAEGQPISDSPEAAQSLNDQLKHAMKAFRKRLKLTRLDEESKLGNRAMTGGRKSAIVAIIPPREFPQSIWDELTRQGKLKTSGGGFYELGDSAD
jgi:hypothetical protein